MRWLSVADFKSNRSLHLVTLLLVSLAMSISLHLTYLPWWCGDSPGYAGPAWRIYHGVFAGYTGIRTPTYPLFLLACEMVGGIDNKTMTPLSGEIVTWTQSLLHIATAPLLYLTMERLLIRPSVSFALSAFFALLVDVAEYQMLILSESLCCFLMVLSTYLATVSIDRLRRGRAPDAIALLAGLAFGAAILVRPNVLFVWIFFAAAIPVLAAWKWFRRPSINVAAAIRQVTRPCVASCAVLLIAWLFINYENTGVITLSTMVDVTRTSAAYNLFDRVHPEDKVLGNIMVYHSHLADPHDLRNHAYVWQALPEIRAQASLMPINTEPTLVDIYRYLGRVANYLLWENPGVWAQNSAADFTQTFDFHFVQISPSELTDPVSLLGTPVIVNITGWKILGVIENAEAWLILALYLLTFVAAAIAIKKAFAAPDFPSALIPLTVAALAVSALACMAAPCIFATYYPRFSVPVIPLFAICAGYVVETYAARHAKR